jgi:hypothetical protein
MCVITINIFPERILCPAGFRVLEISIESSINNLVTQGNVII